MAPMKRKRSSSRRKGRKAMKVMKAMKSKGDDDDDDEEEEGFGEAPKAIRRGKKSVEQQYQKKTQTEHILLRPDTYVGSVEKEEGPLWVYNEKKGEMDYRNISYVPALYKIFDEILVNAADNLQRDPKMNCIKVDIDVKKGRIKVWNNGRGLPIQIHKKHKVFVPELVFGHLLTGDNFGDSEKRVTGGRNGFGAKLTNIFSKRFSMETAEKGKKYSQEWNNNMSKKSKPQIKKHTGEMFTSVEFWPDLSKFGMKDLEADVVALMQKRVHDIMGTSGGKCKVFLNGKALKIKHFEDYCSWYHNGSGHAYAQIGKRWQVLVGRSDGDGFQQCTYVNHISTPKGGTHVEYVLQQLVDAVISRASKQNKGGPEIKKVHVKNHLWLFINCLVENPAFSSQTKETMTLKSSMFGSTCTLSKSFLDEILDNTGIIDAVVAEANAKQTINLDKMASSAVRGKRVLGVAKLEDANDAGGNHSKDCTLILTEGDSAKALAVSGLSVIGRDKYGVFPLRGKLLNVRDTSQKQIGDNKEIMSIIKILGLSFGKKNPQISDLRYGRVMIMADQDFDGSHIKGLLINFFHCWWPSLLSGSKPFIQEFVTPIVKARKGDEVIQFFTQTEYEIWKKKNDGGRGYKIKYYKGLGTSTAAEAKEYFGNMEQHSLDFKWNSPADGKLIDMVFNKARADDRKKWMNKYEEGTFVDHSKTKITYQDFISKELCQYARYDLMRSVPSVMDGLKPTQRKILFASFKKGLKSDMKVAQLIGYVAEHSAYHHGEASLGTTIISMAQDFVGSNNVNLLVPSGQFGTRLQGGKDAASARYIYTRLNPLTRMIFSPLDDAILEYQEEEGQRIEPYWYAPIIPLVLVNGAEGIGTGWSTSIPNYNPYEIINNMRAFIKRKKMKTMTPWYRRFTGTIKPSGEKGKLDCIGTYSEQGRVLQITELPLKKWTQDYKEFLHSLLPGSEKKSKLKIQDVREYHTENTVHFLCRVDHTDTMKAAKEEGGIDHAFKLRSTINETNMVLFDHEGKIHKYKNVVEMMVEFAKVRLKYYDLRKKYIVSKLTLEKELLANRARFIAMIIAKKLHINNRKKADICKDLTRLKFRKFGDTAPPRTGFEYLLIMQIASLTWERKLELDSMFKTKSDELTKVKKTTIQQMWLTDLDVLEENLTEFYKDDVTKESAAPEKKGEKGKKRKSTGDEEGEDDFEADAAAIMKKPAGAGMKLWKGAKGRKGKKGGKAKGRSGKGKGDDDDEDDEDGDDDDGDESKPPADPVDNIFGDGNRWTMGSFKPQTGNFFNKKRRF